VPTDVEWTTLENHLIVNGYNWDETTTGNKIAKSLSSKLVWKSDSSTGAIGNNLIKNNTSGFTALPSGFRDHVGPYYGIGDDSFWWSSSDYNTPLASNWSLVFNDSTLDRDTEIKSYGFSVRCIKD
jgi:uncharacterized protein (TIGR02145 family)